MKYCPGTLAEGFDTYSRTCLKRMFNGRKVNHVLPYFSPASGSEEHDVFDDSRNRISISGVQEKFSVLLDKNKLRLVGDGESGQYILKPAPSFGKNIVQMPANEHLTMQIARQVFGVETAENALVFFKDGATAYLTKRFDINDDGTRLAQDDFASLAGKTPQTHGGNYKYSGCYLDLFNLMKKFIPAYPTEAPKLFKLLVFNYLFSNGDAHLKNFSISETPMGDFRLSPAYDLLNSRIHVDDNDFALEEGLLPLNLSPGNIRAQFHVLAAKVELREKTSTDIISLMSSKSDAVEKLITASYLSDSLKRNYLQSYQKRLKRFLK